MNPGPIDPALLRAYRRGNERAATALHAAAAPAMHAAARAVLRDPALADDAVQSVLCRVLTLPAPRIAAVTDPRAWLIQLTRREAISTLRSRRRREHRARQSGQSVVPQPSHTTPHADDAALHAAIDALPRRLREVIYLKHVAGLTFDQLAVALDANRSTVASRHRQAVERLRASLVVPRHAQEVTHVV